MKKGILFAFGLLIITGILFLYRAPLQRGLAEKLLNASTREFFSDSIRLKTARLDRTGRLHIRGAKGTLKSEGGPVLLEMAALDSEPLLPRLWSSQGTVLNFSGLRPVGAQNSGIKGSSKVKAGREWSSETALEIEGLDLMDVKWLNPENLEGSAGFFKGTLTIQTDAAHPEPQFKAVFMAEKGGTLQARFFEVLLPYLPAMPTKQRLEELATTKKLVKFKDAALRVETAAANRLKVALHISIPDYNVELNINLEIRIEEETTFMELASLMGLLKVEK